MLFGSLVLMPDDATLFAIRRCRRARPARGMGSFVAMLVDCGRIARSAAGRAAWRRAAPRSSAGRLNLNAATDFFWPQILQGAALGLLFVPLTTAAMGDLAREEIGYLTLFNLVQRRQQRRHCGGLDDADAGARRARAARNT